jgi:hypothetical protein
MRRLVARLLNSWPPLAFEGYHRPRQVRAEGRLAIRRGGIRVTRKPPFASGSNGSISAGGPSPIANLSTMPFPKAREVVKMGKILVNGVTRCEA